MKKIIKILSIVLVLVLGLNVLSFAVDPAKFSGASISDGKGGSQVKNVGNTVIGVMQIVATVFAIAILLFVGIKFMMASPSEKANIKGMLIPYIIGAILIFAAIPILGMFKNMASNI